MTRVVMSLLIIIATVVMVFGFFHSDQTPRTMLQFSFLYVAGVVSPCIWTFKLHRVLRPTDQRTRALAWSPVVVGSTTIVLAAVTFI